jgi:glycosyltransferase involved in cell wall biosynthesis
MIVEYVNEVHDLKKYDVLVGIPSYNNAETIANVASVAAKGCLDLNLKALIVNSDGGSTDGTIDAFMNSDTFGVEKMSFKYRGIAGKGSAVRALLEAAHKVRAEVFIMLDSDLRSVQPWWIERLASPIIHGKTDYVAPFYLRHKYDGTITNNICYPLTSVLYGLKIRQPIGGDFGVGRRLIETYLSKPVDTWQTNVARFGIDIWMTTIAINESNKKPLQAALGAKVHDVKDPGKHLQNMFVQVVQTLFDLMLAYEDKWKNVNKVEKCYVYGEQPNQIVEKIVIDLPGLKEKARNFLKNRLEHISYLPWKIVDSVVNSGQIKVDDWVEIVYQVALHYKKTADEQAIVDLLPFYFARIASFVEETRGVDDCVAEEVIEKQLGVFLQLKPSFSKRWFG